MEQGTHAELLALGGVFADMWADQVSSNDEASAHRKSAVVTGFDLDGPTEQDELNGTPQVGAEGVAEDALRDNEASLTHAAEKSTETAPVSFPVADGAEEAAVPAEREGAGAEPAADAPAAAPVAFPSSEDAAPVAFPSADSPAPVAFPVSDSPAPIAFPGSPETGSVREGSVAERTQSPGVTFQDTQTPERTGTPDPEADGKRRRTLSTQGIQRLARRISITTRRQGSSTSIPAIAGSIIPALKRENTARSSTDEGSSKDVSALARDSPSPSVSSDIGKPKGSKIRKEKKDKRKSTS